MLWPHKKGLGNVLSLGVWGSGLAHVVEENDKTLKVELEFPRLNRDELPQLINNTGDASESPQQDAPDNTVSQSQWTPIHDGRFVLVEGAGTQCNPMTDTILKSALQKKKSQLPPVVTYVPSKVLKSTLLESNAIVENAYDPKFRNLFDVISLASGIQKIAYVTGENGNTLVVSELNAHSMSIPEIAGDPLRVDFNESIKHIVWSHETELEVMINRRRTIISQCYLMVMTDNVIYIFESNELLMELNASDLQGVSFSAATFSPFDSRLFCAIDMEGNFVLWHLDKGITYQGKYQQDKEDLSSWKSICWGSTSSSIYISSRSGMREYEVMDAPPQIYDIIATNTWSRILDFKVCSNDRQYGFLLTTKEIIMVLTSPTTTREVSWKHFLADNDPSLKIALLESFESKQVYCAIYSILHEVVLMYEFCFIEGKPTMARNPYILKEGAGSNQHLQLIDLLYHFNDDKDHKNVIGLLEMNGFYSLSATLLADEGGLTLNQTRDKIISEKSSEKYKIFHQFSRKEFKNVFAQVQNTLKISIDNRDPEVDIELVQDYAYKLGSSLKNIQDRKLSLLDLAKEVPQSEDLEEFDTMIEQLVSYFESKNISITSDLPTKLDAKNLEELFEKHAIFLRNDHVTSYNLSRFTTLLGLSLLRCQKKDDETHIDESMREEMESSDEFVRNLLNSWDSMEEDSSNQELEEEEISTQVDEVPTIRITQTQSQTRYQDSSQSRAIRTLGNSPGNSQPSMGTTSPRSQMAIQLGSQSSDASPRKLLLGSSQRFGLSQALSLSQRSQGPPKRKKRRGGFA